MKSVLGKYKINFFHTLFVLRLIAFIYFSIYIIDKHINNALNEGKMFFRNLCDLIMFSHWTFIIGIGYWM